MWSRPLGGERFHAEPRPPAGRGARAGVPHHYLRRPWIVALTSNASKADEATCLAAGMDAFLTKPIRIQQLEEALGRSATPP